MKIKILFILLLALCVGSFTILPLFAAAPADGSTGIQVSTEIVNYPDFTISIPTVIPLGEIQRTAETSIKSADFSVTVSDLEPLEDQRIDVSLISPDGEFYLYSGVYRIPYEIFNLESGGTALESGDVFASFTQSGEVKGRVEVDQSKILAEGTYGASVQFVVEVKRSESAEQQN